MENPYGVAKYTENLENWMGLLPENLRKLPIIYLAIPGTHNSMTYGIDSKSQVAPDAPESVRKVYKFLPLVVRRWAITQNTGVLEQLKQGVRFFDLRVCLYENLFHYCHGLSSFEISGALWQIYRFLTEHPREVIILDFQHFYIGEDDHKFLHRIVQAIFAEKLYTRADGPLTSWTLLTAEKSGKQVVVIYRRKQIPTEFWPSFMWPTPWPNTINLEELEEFLEKTLQGRRSATGHVSQCILTPTTNYIIPRFFLSLRHVAKQVDKHLTEWIKGQRPGPFKEGEKPTANVFLADFADMDGSNFCKLVIGLNNYLNEEE